MHGAELLVPRDDLHRFAIDLREAGEVAYNIEQVRRREHARHEQLLRREGFHAQPGSELRRVERVGVFPFLIVAVIRANRAQLRRLPACRYEQLRRMKQRLRALYLGHILPLVAVAQQLVDGLRQRVFDGGAFGLHHHQRDAVDEEHQIGHDVTLPRRRPGRIHAELIDDEEVIALRVVEIEVVNGDVFAALRSLNLRPLEQQLRGSLVCLDEIGLPQPLQTVDCFIYARRTFRVRLVQPGLIG
ncbi:MAG: hypothetical protein BWY63_02798 [Chloroflexi bacterium ADurb.Bin360]|nr:MAG: hypothetical protein BWY63_02798 [Chloroflexi bacterium ADurb.Bin360]